MSEILKKKNGEEEVLYIIHHKEDGTFEGLTNIFDAWLKEWNEQRLAEGNREEYADEFDVEEKTVSYFEEKS